MGTVSTKYHLHRFESKYGDKVIQIISQHEGKTDESDVQNTQKQYLNDKIIQPIQKEGNKTIDDFKKTIEKDYENLENSLKKNHPHILDNIEFKKRGGLQIILNLQEHLLEYEEIRSNMLKQFQYERENAFTKIQQSIDQKIITHNNSQSKSQIKEYDSMSIEKKKRIREEISKKYKNKLNTQSKLSKPPSQIKSDFIQQKRLFISLIPIRQCEQLRVKICQQFQKTLQDSYSKKSTCC